MPVRDFIVEASFFFFNDTATTEIYTLSQHDALPIFGVNQHNCLGEAFENRAVEHLRGSVQADRKSTRLNSSHLVISYAVFCLKKKMSSSKNTLGAVISNYLAHDGTYFPPVC